MTGIAAHRWAGPVLILFALFHGAMTLVLFPQELGVIGAAGLFGGNEWAFGEGFALAAFWFLAFTWPTLALGIVATASWRTNGAIPGARGAGWVLIGTVVASGLFLPLSGLWAFLIPGAMLAIGGRRSFDPSA